MNPPLLKGRRGTRRSVPYLLAVFTLTVVACEQPPTDVVQPLEAPVAWAAALTDPSTCGLGKKTVEATVLLPNGSPAVNAVLAAVDPTSFGGIRCWARADKHGTVKLPGWEKDELLFLVARDEIGNDWPYREVIPGPTTTDATLSDELLGDPSDPAHRTVLTLVSGTDCTTTAAYTEAAVYGAIGASCVMPGSSLKGLTIPLYGTDGLGFVINPYFTAPDGSQPADVQVAAMSALVCGQLPWLNDQGFCVGNFAGAAAIQSADLTQDLTDNGVDDAVVTNGLAVPAGLVAIEAIGEYEGRAVVGSAKYLDGVRQDAGSDNVELEAFICDVSEQLLDQIESSGSAAGDIKWSQHGYGTASSTGSPDVEGFLGRNLDPLYDELIVQFEVYANATFSGELTLQYQKFGENSARTVQVEFGGIRDAGSCSIGPATGTGLGDGTAVRADTCHELGDNVYKFSVELYGLPATEAEPLSYAAYKLKTNPANGFSGDGLDPSKADLNGAKIEIPLPLLTGDGLQCIHGQTNSSETSWRGGF